MKQAIFMVGAPNSGKSTYINKNLYGLAIVSRDIKVLQLAGTDNYDDAWKKVDQKQVDKMLQEHFEWVTESEQDFVIDMTNMSKKSRKRWLDKIDKSVYEIKAIVFRTPLETLLYRNEQRPGKTIPVNVIHTMFNSYEEPTAEEGFSEIIYV